jgi:hypothetical protein
MWLKRHFLIERAAAGLGAYVCLTNTVSADQFCKNVKSVVEAAPARFERIRKTFDFEEQHYTTNLAIDTGFTCYIEIAPYRGDVQSDYDCTKEYKTESAAKAAFRSYGNRIRACLGDAITDDATSEDDRDFTVSPNDTDLDVSRDAKTVDMDFLDIQPEH